MIKIIYQGRLCNNLIQWLFGKILSLQLNTGYISNEQLTKWFPNTKNNIINENLSNIIELRGHKIDIENILPNQHIILNGFYQRYEYYKNYKNEIKEWLKCNIEPKYKIQKNDIVLHIRRGDSVMNNDLNYYSIKGHCACPLSYWENILDNEIYNKVWIITESPNDKLVSILKNKYNAKIISDSPIEDWVLLKSANKIIMSWGTFSWLAAWLSESEKIYFPLIGDWHPNSPRSKEINLWTDEERYIYYDMKTRKYLTYKSLINY